MLLPSDQCVIGVCEGVIHAGKEADVFEPRQAVPLELACMEATHLTSMVCKVPATDCLLVGSGKRRVALARLSDHQLMGWLTVPTPHPK